MDTDVGLRFSAMSEDEISGDLRARLSPHRYLHSLSTARYARKLAAIFGEDADMAYFTGLVHDCAKPFEGEELLRAGRLGGADEGEFLTPWLLHAPAGAWLAKTRYGVTDPRILTAIRRHAVGARGMSKLDAIIYTADFAEPERERFEGLDYARALAEKDIFAAAAEASRLSSAYAASRGWAIHPNSLEMINDINGG